MLIRNWMKQELLFLSDVYSVYLTMRILQNDKRWSRLIRQDVDVYAAKNIFL